MPIIYWNQTFLLGKKEIDSHHEHLVRLLNKAYDYATTGAPIKKVEGAIKEATECASYLFFLEELWMDPCYPEYGAHKIEHAMLCGQMSDILRDILSTRTIPQLAILVPAIKLFAVHILISDRKYITQMSSDKPEEVTDGGCPERTDCEIAASPG